MSDPGALALFIRNPEPGAVKTRLAATLGPDRAARFYWECALIVMAKALRLPGMEVFVFFRPPEGKARVEELIMSRFGDFEGRFIPAEGGNQGERMHHALENLASSGFRRMFTLGTDSPTLPQENLVKAARALESADCVLGPTWSGGLYLFGAREPDERYFRNVSWSSGLELVQVFDNISSLGRKCALLPRWQDIDTPDDLDFLEGQIRQTDYRRLKELLHENRP